MLLRVSGEHAGLTVDLDVAVDPSRSGDAGVPNGELLLAFASATNRRSSDLDRVRDELIGAVGPQGALEAAATVAAFNGLVRVADGTGIQLDPAMLVRTVDDRAALGIDDFSGASNSEGASTDLRNDASGILGLFS